MFTLHSNIDATISRSIAKIHQLQPGGAVFDAAIHAAAEAHLKNTSQRIHVSGMASDGTDIGQYSSTPMYMNPKNSPSSFEPVGKTGRTVFASTGQPHLTRYFDQGYKAFRQEIGLTSDKVVLMLRGHLRDGLIMIPVTGGYAFSWTDAELHELSQALEKKYAKPIWAPTAGEKSTIIKSVEEKVGELIRK